MTTTEPAVLDPERIDRMRTTVMAEIEEQADVTRRRRKRVRVALAGAAAAAVVAVAGVGIGVGAGLGGSDDFQETAKTNELAQDSGVADSASGEGLAARGEGEDVLFETTVVTTGSMSAEVDDVEAGVGAMRAFAAARDGRIDSEFLEDSGASPYAELTVRVPSGDVEALKGELADLGDVRSVNLERADVAARVADVQARIDSLTASIARLRAIIGESASTKDLLAAEAQLSRRQADLEGLQAQRRVLQDQTSLATITVSLSSPDSARAVEPEGFTGGLTRGWNALVDATNAVVEAAGFLVPWLLPVGLIGAVVVALQRRRRHAR